MSCSDDFPCVPPEFAKLLYERETDPDKQNQNSRSPETESRARTYLTQEEAAEYLRLSPRTLRDNYKHIPSYKLGRKILYTKKDLDGIVRPYSKNGNVDGETSQSGWEGARTYLNRNEAAEYLRVSPKSLENHPKHIPFHKLGDRVLYIKEELDKIIRHGKQGGES
jgi:excisionase family DNA binding protein